MPVLFSMLRVVKDTTINRIVDNNRGSKINALPSIFDKSIRGKKDDTSSRFKEMMEGEIPQTTENISKLADKVESTSSVGVKYDELSDVDKKGIEYTKKSKAKRANNYDKVNKRVKNNATISQKVVKVEKVNDIESNKLDTTVVNSKAEIQDSIQPSQQL